MLTLLKKMDLSFYSLTAGDNLKGYDIIFSDEVTSGDNIIVTDGEDEFRIKQLIFNRNSSRITVGIDPGPSPGIATLADSVVIDKRNLYDFGDLRDYVRRVHDQCTFTSFGIKIGNGDRMNRDRIIRVLRGYNLTLVNEKGSSKTIKRGNDWEAAIHIALSDRLV